MEGNKQKWIINKYGWSVIAEAKYFDHYMYIR